MNPNTLAEWFKMVVRFGHVTFFISAILGTKNAQIAIKNATVPIKIINIANIVRFISELNIHHEVNLIESTSPSTKYTPRIRTNAPSIPRRILSKGYYFLKISITLLGFCS